jgi:mRNA degradation ribonuclease J1/J2
MLGSAPAATPAGAPSVDVVPLGGLGEFGLNMMAISCGETTIVIDAGAMFPDSDLPGVDLIVPDLSYLEARRDQVQALILTHGHEDHIGAVPYLLPLVKGPVYGTRLALALVEPKLEEHGIPFNRKLPVGMMEYNSNYTNAAGGSTTPDSFYNALWLADIYGRMVSERPGLPTTSGAASVSRAV